MRIFYLLFGLILVMFLALPLALGENGFMIILDNLDSEFVFLHVLKLSGLLFSTSPDAVVENVMNGLPRSYFHSEFNVIRVLFYLFPSMIAYIINGAMIRVIGFCGMFLLTRDHLLRHQSGYAPYLAFMFACIPLYTIFGVTVSGLPFLLWAFLNLRTNEKQIPSWSVVILFPFYAHFALVGPFIVIMLIAFGLFVVFYKGKVHVSYWFGMGVLTVLFLVGQLSLITSFFFSGASSQRSSWNLPIHGLGETLSEFGKIFIRGHYHVSTFIAIPLYIIIFSSIPLEFNKRIYDRRVSMLVLLILVFAVIYPVYPYVRSLLKDGVPILMSFQFSRFIFLIPLLWFVALAIAIQETRWRPILCSVLLLIQFGLIIYSNNELKMNVLHGVGISTKGFYFDQPSFTQFFEPSLFAEIKSHIGRPQRDYRVVSVGLHPSVAQYNGFYTLDGYQNNFPLVYKNEFRKIIAGELNKDESMRVFFDDWGSRCYIFSAEIWRRCKVDYDKLQDHSAVSELILDTEQLKKMGGQYIFSALPILNYAEIGLKFEKGFSGMNSQREIYLYKVF